MSSEKKSHSTLGEIAVEIERLEQTNKELIEALKFYAQQSEEQWMTSSSGPTQVGTDVMVTYSERGWKTSIIIDRGDKAREALAKAGVK